MARKSNPPSLFNLDDASVAVAEDPTVVARREKYRALLAEKLKDPEFRKIEGFPIGTDDAILALSDPPNYTACPNPFLDEWVAQHAKAYDATTDRYHREPFAADVTEGKNHPIYNAHSYHTKVPHRAIMRYILHYTLPGDVVYDGFCGTGMTGVAAQLCGDKSEVESLMDPVEWDKKGKVTRSVQAYFVDSSGDIWDRFAWAIRSAEIAEKPNPYPHLTDQKPFSKIGVRKAILNDLSPAASFIAYNYNTPVDPVTFAREARRVLSDVKKDCGWMYTTLHGCAPADVARWAQRIDTCQTVDEARAVIGEIPFDFVGEVQFTLVSDRLICPDCGHEMVFYDVAVDEAAANIRDNFPCPNCRTDTSKGQCSVKKEISWDPVLGESAELVAQSGVRINYLWSGGRNRKGGGRNRKVLDTFDIALWCLLARLAPEHAVPHGRTPLGDESRRNDPLGIRHFHQFHYPRNIHTLATAWFRSGAMTFRDRAGLRMAQTAAQPYCSRLRRFRPDGKGGGPLSGTLYVPSLATPPNDLLTIERNLASVSEAFAVIPAVFGDHLLSVGSAAVWRAKPESVDYIFTDPPFGGNLEYSALNCLWESWLQVSTDASAEAITSTAHQRTLQNYQRFMTSAFEAYFLALKPGRWMTVEFHNSANKVWLAVQRAVEQAGFVLADVRILDKQQFSFKQVSASGATDKDLVISCYKPTAAFERAFTANLGQPAAVREFVEQHLTMLPVASVTKTGDLERLAERTTSILYDRMIAYHLVRGAQVPMSASEFTKLLNDDFVLRDDMWFLPGQGVRYDLCKLRGVHVEQQPLFVVDERSAVAWLRSALAAKSQTLGELTPQFMQATKPWPAQEPRPELRDILRDWFIEIDGRWANPNPDDETHVEALRKKSLLRLFSTYAAGNGKLKEFRHEALIEAFRYCWNSGQEAVFVAVCQRIPDKLLLDDPQLSEAYDLAADRVASYPPSPHQEFKWE